MIALMFASEIPPLFTDSGAATAIGVWVLMAIVAGAAALFIYNQALTARLNRKLLNAPAPTQQQIAQPLIVAMEKEFVHRREYDRDWDGFREEHGKTVAVVKDRIETVAKYTDDRIHECVKHVATVSEDGHRRNEKLAALEADSKTHTGQLSALNTKMDHVVDRVGDKVEQLIRDGVIRTAGGKS